MTNLLLNCEATRLEVLHQYQILDTAPEAIYDELTQLAAQICQAVLWELDELTVPDFLSYLMPVINMLPSKCLVPLYHFSGGFESMDKFIGRTRAPHSDNSQNDTNNNKDH